ncbi:MAG: DUF4396 domain-containing protein [Devosia sp.]
MVPFWLTVLTWMSLGAGVVSALWIALDVLRHPQQMVVMNLVWPICGLFGPGLMIWAYYAWGRSSGEQPFAVSVFKGALHCGSGCTLGDIAAEALLLSFPGLAAVFGLGFLFGDEMFAAWVLDYILAFVIGIIFQYFAIVPMRHLSPGEGVVQAVKADAASLTAWQVGMYGFMAIAQFGLFRAGLGLRLAASMPEFWFMMQIAMLCGLATSYPVNWWLLRAGLKEKM